MKNKGIRKQSDKQRKLEQKRFSILTGNLQRCYECGKTKDQIKIDIHEIYKGSNRRASMVNGFCVPLCRECHQRTENDIKFYRKFQKICKDRFLETHDLSEFIAILGKSF